MTREQEPVALVDSWLDRGDGQIFAQHAGRGHPMLLVHGWPLDRRIFSPQIAFLARHLLVIVYDRRGFGLSTAPPDLSAELDDIDAILDRFTDEPVHLLGMSQGGRIALRYAVTRPERLRSLILQGAVVDGLKVPEREDERIPLAEYADLASRDRIEEVRARHLRHPMMDLGDEASDAAHLRDRIIGDYSGRDLRVLTERFFDFPIDVPAAAAKLRIPALILTGARETSSRRREAAELLNILPAAEEVRFEHSGHLCNLTEPGHYNRSVLKFCRRIDSPDA